MIFDFCEIDTATTLNSFALQNFLPCFFQESRSNGGFFDGKF